MHLADGTTYPAEVIGSDQKTDVALIKIKDGPGNLPYAPLGDSDKIEIGEWVMAIGNPYGLEHTVTVGIVSATGRSIGAGPYDDFIQTDASINPGNSGGPLFNTAGEVIGMNTAIIPGGQGLGFAVPVNMIKEILPQLRKSGKVTRALLGVVVQELTPELARQFGIDKSAGALVSQVTDDSAAEKAGVRPGDVILEFNGKPIQHMRELPITVARAPIGVPVPMLLLREGKQRKLEVKLDQLVDEDQSPAQTAAGPPTNAAGRLGITVRPAEDAEGGLQVVAVQPSSPADRAGVQEGDVIRSANRHKLRTAADLQEAMHDSSGAALLLVERDGRASFVVIQLNK